MYSGWKELPDQLVGRKRDIVMVSEVVICSGVLLCGVRGSWEVGKKVEVVGVDVEVRERHVTRHRGI